MTHGQIRRVERVIERLEDVSARLDKLAVLDDHTKHGLAIHLRYEAQVLKDVLRMSGVEPEKDLNF